MLRGARVEPGEIEQALLQHAAVLEATVVAREDPPHDKRLTAYVVPAEPSTKPQDLRACLADFAFVMMKHLPVTPDGQLDRTALPAPDGRRDGPGEMALAQIWADVLWLDEVGVEDDIVELSADSHHVFQISTRTKAAGIAVTPKQLLAERTISGVLLTAGSVLFTTVLSLSSRPSRSPDGRPLP